MCSRSSVARGQMRFGLVTVVLLVGACQETQAPVGPTPGRPRFDGAAAMEHVETQVAFGPRVPGTEGHRLQLDWMVARLDSLSPDVSVDTFTHVATSGDTLGLFNVTARFQPEATRRILLLAHWDTRPRSDQAADAEQQEIPVPGANDGASGTAVLLELAEVLAGVAAPMGIDLLFVDGEDYGPELEDMLLGGSAVRRHSGRAGHQAYLRPPPRHGWRCRPQLSRRGVFCSSRISRGPEGLANSGAAGVLGLLPE